MESYDSDQETEQIAIPEVTVSDVENMIGATEMKKRLKFKESSPQSHSMSTRSKTRINTMLADGKQVDIRKARLKMYKVERDDNIRPSPKSAELEPLIDTSLIHFVKGY